MGTWRVKGIRNTKPRAESWKLALSVHGEAVLVEGLEDLGEVILPFDKEVIAL